MTDIYDFRDPIFTTYTKEWNSIYKMINKHCAIINDVIEWARYYHFFKKYKPLLWEKCPDDIIWMFIIRGRQIVHHEHFQSQKHNILILPDNILN